MNVFIAGANNRGRSMSQARTTQVWKKRMNPFKLSQTSPSATDVTFHISSRNHCQLSPAPLQPPCFSGATIGGGPSLLPKYRWPPPPSQNHECLCQNLPNSMGVGREWLRYTEPWQAHYRVNECALNTSQPQKCQWCVCTGGTDTTCSFPKEHSGELVPRMLWH